MTKGAPTKVVIIFKGKVVPTNEWQTTSENNKIIEPISAQENKCIFCCEVLKIIRDNNGTAIPTNATGPQNAVVSPVNTDEIKIR